MTERSYPPIRPPGAGDLSLRSIVALVSFFAITAGCMGGSDPAPTTPAPTPTGGATLGNDTVAVFSAPKIIDSLRAGGEPVITVTPKGTILVAAHPGYTHWHPTPGSPTSHELLVPTQGQSYMWRSTDKGSTWKHISLLPVDSPNSGPRGIGQGVSDPDFAIDSKGRIYMTDLEALAEISVSWSDDDGVTWLDGNNAAAGGPIDRQWLATVGTTIYFRGNYQASNQDVRKSTDGGRTFQDVGRAGCGGDMVANPLNGHLYVGCSNGVSVSSDGGKTFARKASGVSGVGPITTEPAIDSNGTIYRAFDPGRRDLTLVFTRDEGATWGNISLKRFFPELAEGTLIWPWTSAGSEGRVSVSFYASPKATAYEGAGGDWFVYNAIILNATSANPVVYPSKVTPTPFHKGPMCQRGTVCQASTATSQQSDRRLGDFFESTIDAEGFVHIVWSDTQAKPTDTISHVGYSRLTGGPRLWAGPPVAGFPTQG